VEEPFAWQSREFLRKLCIGKVLIVDIVGSSYTLLWFSLDEETFIGLLFIVKQDVTFRVDYTVPSIGREFGSIFLGDKNVALLVVSEDWAKVCMFSCVLGLNLTIFFLVLACISINIGAAGEGAGSTESRS
jgi:staphylococcal nuclease domain-containing protein 1